MAEMEREKKEGNVVLDVRLGRSYIEFCDDDVIKDEQMAKKQLTFAEQIIFNGMSKIQNQ